MSGLWAGRDTHICARARLHRRRLTPPFCIDDSGLENLDRAVLQIAGLPLSGGRTVVISLICKRYFLLGAVELFSAG